VAHQTVTPPAAGPAIAARAAELTAIYLDDLSGAHRARFAAAAASAR